MTILQSLYQYYARMSNRGEVEPFGFTRENISFVLVLSDKGSLVDIQDIRQGNGTQRRPVKLSVPQPGRTSNIQSNFLWDKTAYAFGVDSGKSKRIEKEHAAFRQLHEEFLKKSDDWRAIALLKFIRDWQPTRFDENPFRVEMLDQSFVFRIDSERSYIHETPSLRDIWLNKFSEKVKQEAFCLVSGKTGPLERLHPVLKGVNGAQTSGAYLVSFNAPAFTSYENVDGANAPTSEEAAASYGAALNRMLDRGSANRLRRSIGDATVVFWADTSDAVDEAAAEAAEGILSLFAEPPEVTASASDDDRQEAAKLRDALDKVAEGRPLAQLDPKLVAGTRLHVLGLAPNAARLSVRFWLTDSLDAFVKRLAAHYADLRIEPKPFGWGVAPAVGRLLVRTTALQEKFENIPPLLAGEVTRAVLDGRPYPRTWLAASVIRLRAGDDPGRGWHAAAIKACLNRPFRMEIERLRSAGGDRAVIEKIEKKEMLPVALDTDFPDTAYQLGRLFFVLEAAQRAALGQVNASIADRYYGAASATPARVFGPLLRGLRVHVSDARRRGFGGWIEPRVAEIMSHLPPEWPRTLKLEEQGRFAVGYYHERGSRPKAKDEEAALTAAAEGDK